ncbi:MAG TPA: FtsX-like permease family protein, partial [Thermoanaerobaculia bacterium]|nr:FtsX-like permease family protein [Thermoanaerobaculia bacterium]
IGIPFLRGRTFSSNQRFENVNETIISAGLAHDFLPNEDPIGKHLVTADGHRYEIVGVVGNTRYLLDQPPEPMMYFPIDSGDENDAALVVRAVRNPRRLAVPIEQTIQQMDRELAVSDVLTMDEIINRSSINANFEATLLATFAAISLLLAAVGLFGVLAYVVAQRRSEIGIRLALGAQPHDVLRLVLFDGLSPAVGGVIAGSVLATGAAQLIRSNMYATRPLDPAVFGAVIAVLFAVAAAACLLPAWRASRVDPSIVLRSE